MNIRKRTFVENKVNLTGEGLLHDVLFANKLDNGETKKIFSPGNWPSSNEWEPIGIVAIPTSHKVYGNINTCGVVSLVPMSIVNPLVGNREGDNANEAYLMFGPKKDESLSNYTGIVYHDNLGGEELITTEELGKCWLPTNYIRFTNLETCYHDSNSSYMPELGYHIPSPYLTNGSRNPMYSKNPIDGVLNAFSDFNGKENSNILLQVRGSKDYTTWSPTNSDLNTYPAVSCCDMYHTLGTNQGDWYLPALGEIGYYFNKISSIRECMNNLNEVYGNVAKVTGGYLISSTEYSSAYYFNIYMGSGSSGTHSKTTNSSSYVYAFYRYSPELEQISPDDYVDLDLSSGTLWANKNLGASHNYDYGDFYRFGGTISFSNYSSGAYTSIGMYEGNESPFPSEYDIVTLRANGNTSYCIPTKNDFEELLNNTNWFWNADYLGTGVKGLVFQSKTNNLHYIFIPAGGMYPDWDRDKIAENVVAYLWTSTLNSNNKSECFYGGINSSSIDNMARNSLLNVRGIKRNS